MKLKLKKSEYVPVLILLMFFWALMHPLSKMIVSSVSSSLMAFLSTALGSIALFLFLIWQKQEISIDKKDILPLFLIGICGTALSSLFLFIGIDLSNATNASILVNSNPIFVALLAPFILSEKLNKKQLFGVLLAFIGMVLVTTNGLGLNQLIDSSFFLGNIALITSALFITIYTIFGKKYIKKYGGLLATFYTVLAGAIFLLIYTTANGDIVNALNLSIMEWLIVLYIGIVITGFIFAVWYESIKHIGAVRASSFKLLIPVFATITAILLIGESPSLFAISGGVLVILGLALTQKILKIEICSPI